MPVNGSCTTARAPSPRWTGRSLMSKTGMPKAIVAAVGPAKSLLETVASDALVPLVAVAVVVDAIALGPDHADDDRGVVVAVPLGAHPVADLVLVGLGGLDGRLPHLRGRLGDGDLALDVPLDAASRDRLVPDLV